MQAWRIGIVLLSVLSSNCMSEVKVLSEETVPSRHLPGGRVVRVHLPPSYASSPRKRYPVLYLHDGQNVFSSAGTNCCFGWGNWDLDTTADRLMAQGRMREIVMVAIDNSRARYKEYRGLIYKTGGKRPGKSTGTNDDVNARSEAYARFLIEELKPKIDREYRTLKTAASTAIMGSSLGGICSLSLAWEHPKTFGMAASLSGSFQIEKRNFLTQVLKPYDAKAKPLRLYLDSGVVDYTGDDDGRRYTDAVAAELLRIGWKEGRTLHHYTDEHTLNDEELDRAGLRRDKWEEARRSQHNEFYWRMRAWRALEFMFPPK